MATYEEIYGKRVEVLDADPTLTSSYEGQVWYNSASGTLKTVVTSAAWVSSTVMPISKYAAQGGGTQTAAFVAGGGPGSSPPFPGNASVTTVEYNGIGWSSGGDLGMARYAGAAAGTLTAGILAAGYNQQSPYGRNLTETYDGSSWTEVGDLSTAGYNTGSAIGTETATVVGTRIQFSGGPSATLLPSATVEEFDGSSWTAGGDRGTAVISGVNYGTLTAGVSATGATATPGSPKTTDVKNYDGTSWTAAPSVNSARRELGGGGIQTAAIIFGGDPDPGSSTTATETFDGTSWATSPATMGTAMVNMGFSSNSTSTAAFSGGGSNPGPVTNVTEEYNVSINTITNAAWASAPSTNTALGTTAGCGSVTAGLVFSGADNLANSEKYDGTSWTATPALNVGRYGAGEATNAPQTAALCFGGYTNPPGTNRDATEEWNGSAWAAQTALPVAMRQVAGCGTQTAAVSIGGYSTTFVPESYEYNGSSWTASGNVNTDRERSAGCGLETAGLAMGGNNPTPHIANVEEYDGSSWTNATALPTANKLGSAAGIQTDAIFFAGNVPPNSVVGTTLGYDGTNWSTRPSMGTARQAGAGAGTSTAALMMSGANGSGTAVTTVEEFTGVTETINAKTLTTS